MSERPIYHVNNNVIILPRQLSTVWNVFYISTYMPPDREHSCTLVFKHNVIQQMSIM
jgi:hypothetical protein